MLLPRMDLLIHRFMDKMNNNIGRLHYDSYDDDSGDSRMNALSSSVGHRPPSSPTKRKYDDGEQVGNSHDYEQMTKMSRLITTHIGNPSNGDSRQEPWNPFDHASSVISSLHGSRLYAPFPIFAIEQPLALTKNSMDVARSPLPSSLGSAERQQNRPSVITCAPASNRTCSLSNCHMSHNGCTPAAANSKNKSNEEHFRRSLGRIYREPEPEPASASNSVSITGSVDDHFAQALGDTWLQIKARGSGSSSPQSTS